VREQVIAQKVGNRSGIGKHRRSSEATQRPRRRESSGAALVTRLRAVLGYVPAFLKVLAAIVVGIVMFAGYRAAASASFFQVRRVEVQGTSRVSADEVQLQVRREVEKSGVWKADLAGINARLEKLPWVRTAVVSRVLPDSVRVRITERVPRAVARTASGRFRWVDDDAVLLGEMLPTDQMPPFFLRGLNEDDPEGARAENRERVAKFIALQQAWDAAGLSERVSEVNVIDVRDIRAQLAGDDSHIEVRLGSQDHGKRLKDALEVLDAQRQSPRGALISYIDLSQGRRAIVGLTSGAHTNASAQSTGVSTESLGEKTSDQAPVLSTPREKAIAAMIRTSESRTSRNRSDNSRTAEKKSDKTKKSDRRKP
jgi:cell division septal protein FtsQ